MRGAGAIQGGGRGERGVCVGGVGDRGAGYELAQLRGKAEVSVCVGWGVGDGGVGRKLAQPRGEAEVSFLFAV